MYAVIATGGKQYKVAEGDIIRVEKLNAEDGAKVTFDTVVLVNNDKDVLVGDKVASSKVEATVLKTAKAKKVTVYKYKPKKGFHKKNGHRQPFTEVKIEAIKTK